MKTLLVTLLLLAALPAMADQTGADQLYQQGVAAYKIQDYPRAIRLFDAAIAANPAHAGALLDRAISQYEQGDLDAARDSFARLSRLADIPPPIAELVQHYREALDTPPDWNRQHNLSFGLGRSNNANQGLGNSQFEFGELDPYYLARADDYAEWQYQLDAQRLSDNHHRYLLLYQRQWQRERDANQALILGGASWQWPRAHGTVHLHGQLGQSFQNGNTLYQAGSTSVAWQQPLLTGQLWLRGGLQQRQHPQDAASSNRVWQLGASYRLPRARQQWQLDVALARDQALANRPGGERQRKEIAVQAQWLLGPRLLLQANIGWTQEQQAEIFSSLFGDTRRRDNTVSQGLGLQWQLPENEQLTLGWQRQKQRSNIVLYAISQQEWRLGWQKSW